VGIFNPQNDAEDVQRMSAMVAQAINEAHKTEVVPVLPAPASDMDTLVSRLADELDRRAQAREQADEGEKS
jgi:hypothetical protein